MERAKLGTGLHAKPLHQALAGRPVHGERVLRPPASIERAHQLASKVLPKRARSDESVELGHGLGVAPRSEIGLDPRLEATLPELVQPRDLVLREGLERELSEGLPPPQRERLAKDRARARRV